MKRKSNGSAPDTFDPKALFDLHAGYLDRRWEMALAVAWKEYLALRRGALLSTPSADPRGEWDCMYLPLDLIEGHPLMKEYSNMLRSYDPTKQVVALFLTPPTRVSAYRGGLTPERVAPPEVHKRIGDLLDSN